jgi:hypothetical protein
MAVKFQMLIFWVCPPFNIGGIKQRFGGTYCHVRLFVIKFFFHVIR